MPPYYQYHFQKFNRKRQTEYRIFTKSLQSPATGHKISSEEYDQWPSLKTPRP
jgi:hypothetical protein